MVILPQAGVPSEAADLETDMRVFRKQPVPQSRFADKGEGICRGLPGSHML